LAAKEDLPITLNTHFSVLHHEDSSFVIGAGFELIQSKPDKKDKPVLTIAMSFSALFEEASKNDGDWINRFSQGEARLIFWPYLRYFVSDMTSRMSINPIVIPLTSQLDEAKPKK
jgi:preprotein translocase subunit SecB